MYKEICEAFWGKCIWNWLTKRYAADKYIFMPHAGDEYNQYALKYLDEYLKKEKASSAVVVTTDEGISLQLKNFKSRYKIQCQLWTKNKIMKVVRFYGLYFFSPKIIIISLTLPYDTCGENLLGVHGITKQELLCYDIYHFSSIPESTANQ